MKNFKHLLVMFLGIVLVACNDDPDEVVDPIITVTPPATYAFERDGASTVSFSGQSSRLEMAAELGTWLNTPIKTAAELDAMFNDGTGFGNPALAASGKKLGNKTASSSQASSTVKPLFDAMITDVTTNVFPNVANDASAGTPGTYTDPGGRTVIINGKGHEVNQLFVKGLMGALVCDQIIWGYLSAGKLDGGTNKADNDAGTLVDGKAYTQMEHYWDEGFGYLYGLDADLTTAAVEAGSSGGDVLVSKYMNKVDGSSLPGISQEIYDAFKHGRAAIVAGAYDVRDEQAAIVSTKLSHVIGRKAADYLNSGADKIDAGKWADAHHALSEGWGFILSLQFTKNADTGSPYYSNSEVNSMLTQIDDFWTVTPADLRSMAASIEAKFGF